MEKQKALRGDSEFGRLVGMEDLCRKIRSEKLNTARLEEVWEFRGLLWFCFIFISWFAYLLIYFLKVVEGNGYLLGERPRCFLIKINATEVTCVA